MYMYNKVELYIYNHKHNRKGTRATLLESFMSFFACLFVCSNSTVLVELSNEQEISLLFLYLYIYTGDMGRFQVSFLLLNSGTIVHSGTKKSEKKGGDWEAQKGKWL